LEDYRLERFGGDGCHFRDDLFGMIVPRGCMIVCYRCLSRLDRDCSEASRDMQ
jgi:hypothetical protein